MPEPRTAKEIEQEMQFLQNRLNDLRKGRDVWQPPAGYTASDIAKRQQWYQQRIDATKQRLKTYADIQALKSGQIPVRFKTPKPSQPGEYIGEAKKSTAPTPRPNTARKPRKR